MTLSTHFDAALELAHPSWYLILRKGLQQVEKYNPGYLAELSSSTFLPLHNRIFAAFSIPLNQVQFVLVGEGPYPRAESANGYCFMDAAVDSLWSIENNGGLSKSVNRATSLRNFIKMLLVAERYVSLDSLGRDTIAEFSAKAKRENLLFVQTMADLQSNFLSSGFLLLNATPVFRAEVPPAKEARAWFVFLQVIFEALADRKSGTSKRLNPTVILWGKIADRLQELDALNASKTMNIVKAEHPYNLSFISNCAMQELFAPLRLLCMHSNLARK